MDSQEIIDMTDIEDDENSATNLSQYKHLDYENIDAIEQTPPLVVCCKTKSGIIAFLVEPMSEYLIQELITEQFPPMSSHILFLLPPRADFHVFLRQTISYVGLNNFEKIVFIYRLVVVCVSGN